MATVIAYVDGFNLYHGLHQGYGRAGTSGSISSTWFSVCGRTTRSWPSGTSLLR
jgi:hypothetical protein